MPNPCSVFALWPKGRMPGRKAEMPEEELPSWGGRNRRLTHISRPEIAVYPASAAENASPAPAVIICPGGGYGWLSYDKEGTEIASWLRSFGITGILLKYRVPDNRDGAFQDIQRAIRLIRAHASAWNIAHDKIGVLGFSAGGHLCARISNGFAQAAYPILDSVDKEGCRPDFAVLVYPAFLAPTGELAPELVISKETSPTLLIHTEDDPKFVAGTKIYGQALEAAQVSHRFLLFKTGGHGFGLRSDKEAAVWPQMCLQWLGDIGIL